MLASLGLSTITEFCGDTICEQCFQQIVDIDLFKKKCQEAQQEICLEILEIKNKIQEVRNNKMRGRIWNKNNIELKSDMEMKEQQLDTSALDILEEHLVDDAEFENVNYEIVQDNEEYIEEIHDGFKIVYQQLPENNPADDAIIKEIVDGEMMQEENIEVMEIVNLKSNTLTNDISLQGVDEYEASTDDIIKNPERNRFCFRIYECFFCKMVKTLQDLFFFNYFFFSQKFAGRKTYVAHKCAVSEVKCELCEKLFNRIQAYNSHMSHVHSSLPISKHFCPLCKTVIMATLNQFKQHRRQCNKNMKNQPIECEVCNKVCNNLKGYTIHKLFHDTRNFTTSTGEKIASEGLNSSKGLLICEVKK